MKTYTYDPEKINEKGLDQMRFELGDTMTEGGGETCALSDEEYLAVLQKSEGSSWRKLKIECLKAVVMKLAYEVDYSADGLTLEMSQRFKNWKHMLDSLEKAAAIPSGTPGVHGQTDSGHYFRLGMQENMRAR